MIKTTKPITDLQFGQSLGETDSMMLQQMRGRFGVCPDELSSIATSGFALFVGYSVWGPEFFISTYPKVWQDEYTQRRYFLTDPVFIHAASSASPRRWSEVGLSDFTNVAERAAAHGLRYGAVISNAPRPKLSMLSVARHDRELTDAEMEQIVSIFDKIRSSVNVRPILAEKQVEVLRLIASGYSERQAAERLDVSLATVKARLSSARRSNGCANTIQLVVLAVRAGLI